MRVVAHEFVARPAMRVARDLLGCKLVRELPTGERLVGSIVETEAYVGVRDEGCHSFGGRRTPRVEAMYAKAGTAYVYFTYGMHYCFNVVCGEVGEPVAVLIRAVEPIEGLEAMRRNRSVGMKSVKRLRDRDLCSGPAKLCEAFAIGPQLNFHDLLVGNQLWLERGETVPAKHVAKTARIGIGTVGVWKTKPLRFVIRGNPHVSVPVS